MSTPFQLHHLARRGDLQAVRELLQARPPAEEIDINAFDDHGYTPLMRAVESPKAGVELVRVLLEHGASIYLECLKPGGPYSMAALCLSAGDPEKLGVLLEHGASLRYERRYATGECYDALIDAVHGRDLARDPYFIDLLKMLISYGVPLNGMGNARESGLRVVANRGRFDAVRLLLKAGADAAYLEWTPLMRAVALGSLNDVEKAVERGADLEAKDYWGRTAWLVALQTGDIAKARFLMERGADTTARGRCGKPALFYAIGNHHTPMLQWLLEIGQRLDQTDEFGTTPLMTAVESENAQAIDILLAAGADVNTCKGERRTALSRARTPEIAMRLLHAGADPGQMPFEARRALLGLEPEPDEGLLDVSPEDYRKGRARRFGTSNPEKMVGPFWDSMIRAGVNAYRAEQRYEGKVKAMREPVWCAERFGQSITFLPDGRIVQIGGEHEDSYMKDFCIYNDVFLHEPDGSIHIFGYSESVFPPTDFHTATSIGEFIYIVGSLGYYGKRQYGMTPVYRLHTKTFRMEPVIAGGEAPGWIFRHRALRSGAHEIRILGGEIATGTKESHQPNEKSFILDTKRLVWRVADGARWASARRADGG